MEGMMSSGPDVLIHDEDEDASDSEDCNSLSFGFCLDSLCCSSSGVLLFLVRTDLGVGVGLASSGLS